MSLMAMYHQEVVQTIIGGLRSLFAAGDLFGVDATGAEGWLQ